MEKKSRKVQSCHAGQAGNPAKEIDLFSHVFVGVSDFERALAFYAPVMEALGCELRFCDTARPWAGWQVPGMTRPLFLVGAPYDQNPPAPGNGQMTAFLAAAPRIVDAVFNAALRHGGTADGSPGLRPEYHANYYGAYFRDPDGNKLCVVCHERAT
jgi:catechol 2,3-dioxygenase-like lactoylglutathione lyase family enzyme